MVKEILAGRALAWHAVIMVDSVLACAMCCCCVLRSVVPSSIEPAIRCAENIAAYSTAGANTATEDLCASVSGHAVLPASLPLSVSADVCCCVCVSYQTSPPVFLRDIPLQHFDRELIQLQRKVEMQQFDQAVQAQAAGSTRTSIKPNLKNKDSVSEYTQRQLYGQHGVGLVSSTMYVYAML